VFCRALKVVGTTPSPQCSHRQIEQGRFSNEITLVLQAIGAATADFRTADFLTLAKFRDEIRSGPKDNR